MQTELGRLDPFTKVGSTGVLGRLSDILEQNEFKVHSFSIDAGLANLEGNRGGMRRAVDSDTGFIAFNPSAGDGNMTMNKAAGVDGNGNNNLKNEIRTINKAGNIHNNIFSETFSVALVSSSFFPVNKFCIVKKILRKDPMIFLTSDTMFELLNTQKSHTMNEDALLFAQRNGTEKLLNKDTPNTALERKMQLVAKMIGSNECRGVDRDIFYVEDGSYDHHANLHRNLNLKFDELNSALNSFVQEMVHQKKWQDVTIVVTSDFGRTITPNTNQGTDHAWSGNSFILGGNVAGGKVLGDYPRSFSKTFNLNIGRGRLIPTRPWESLWNGVIQWFGVGREEDLDYILPNRNNFPGEIIYQKNDLFDEVHNHVDESSGEISDCKEGIAISCDPLFDAAASVQSSTTTFRSLEDTIMSTPIPTRTSPSRRIPSTSSKYVTYHNIISSGTCNSVRRFLAVPFLLSFTLFTLI